MKTVLRLSGNKIVGVVVLALTMLAVPTAAHAQTGCGDSPENPTIVLALVGSAGAFFSVARNRIKARRK